RGRTAGIRRSSRRGTRYRRRSRLRDEELIEAGQLEDLLHAWGGADHREGALDCAQLLVAGEQHAQPRGAEECDAGEVELDLVRPAADRFLQLVAEVVRPVGVQPARHAQLEDLALLMSSDLHATASPPYRRAGPGSRGGSCHSGGPPSG